jgi:lysophospholipase
VTKNVRAIMALPPKGRYGFLDASDGTSIRYVAWSAADGAAPRRGTVVLLTGRREFIEKYSETITELLQRGFAVCTMDWRGQGLSTRPLPDRQKGYVRSFDDYVTDLHQFIETIVRPNAPEPYFFLAQSMGAHCALRYMHDHPDVFEGAVLTAPMIDIGPGKVLHAILSLAITLVTWFGGRRSYVLGGGRYTPKETKFAGNRLTSDPGRFHVETGWVGANPDLALGSATYGWVRAALKSIRLLKSRGYVERIRVPVLMITAGADEIVRNEAAKRLANRMSRCSVVQIDGAKHEIFQERDEYRAELWRQFDAFIAAR